MNIKSSVIIVLFIFSIPTNVIAVDKEFEKRQIYLTPQIAYYTFAPNLGVSLEYGLTENIGIGGSLMFSSWSTGGGMFKVSESLITPSLDVYYHFTQPHIKKIDLFAGISLGYSIYSWSWDLGESDWSDKSSSGLFLSPIFGVRYYFSPKLAISLRTNYSALGDWSGIGGVLGITFKTGK